MSTAVPPVAWASSPSTWPSRRGNEIVAQLAERFNESMISHPPAVFAFVMWLPDSSSWMPKVELVGEAQPVKA